MGGTRIDSSLRPAPMAPSSAPSAAQALAGGNESAELPSTAPSGSAPPSATPVPDLKLASSASSARDPAASAPELQHLDAEPQKQGFFGSLISGLKSFVKENASTVLAFGVIGAVTVLTGGAAAVVPMLIGLAAGGATVGACAVLMRDRPQEEDEDDALDPQEAPAPQAQMAAHGDEASKGPVGLQIETVDLLGLDKPAVPRPAESVDLLDLTEPNPPRVLPELADLKWDPPPVNDALVGLFDSRPEEAAASASTEPVDLQRETEAQRMLAQQSSNRA